MFVNYRASLKKMLPQLKRQYRGTSRQGKTLFDSHPIQSPEMTSQELLNFHILAQQGRIQDISKAIRRKRQGKCKMKINYFLMVFISIRLFGFCGEFCDLNFDNSTYHKPRCRVGSLTQKGHWQKNFLPQ